MNERALSRRKFLGKTGAWAGAGLLLPALSLIDAGKGVAAAYPDDVLSVEAHTNGKVRPGMVISKDNVDLIKDIAPRGLEVELERGAEIKIVETTTKPDALVPPYWVQATLRNNGQAVLDDKGQLWTRDGRPWIGGDPFPEATTGLEAMWNHSFNAPRYDDLIDVGKEFHIDTSGAVVREGVAFSVRIQTAGRVVVDPKPAMPRYRDELYRSAVTALAPFDAYGFSANTTVYYDAARMPDTHVYIPTLRRVRRVLSTQRFEAATPYANYFISDLGLHNDPLLTWSWKLVGRKPMLAPSPHNRGMFARPEGKDDFTFTDTSAKFPRSSWELRPEILLVDGVSHLRGCPYRKKRLYVDAIYHRAHTAEMWNRAGNLWKFCVLYVGDTGVTDHMGSTARDLTGIMFADVLKDYHSNAFFYPRLGDVELEVNAGLRISNWNTPSALLRRARR